MIWLLVFVIVAILVLCYLVFVYPFIIAMREESKYHHYIELKEKYEQSIISVTK